MSAKSPSSAASAHLDDHEDQRVLEHPGTLMIMDAGVDVDGDGSAADRAYAAAAAVLDPEVPVLTIADLGVLRGVEVTADDRVVVTITPTYSGCPAMDAIRTDVTAAVSAAGFADVEVRTVLAPAWTTDWMTAEAKAKLSAYGIAPPGKRTTGPVLLPMPVRCPQCGSLATRELSRFGSTACKALWVCTTCAEPFDHFKAL